MDRFYSNRFSGINFGFTIMSVCQVIKSHFDLINKEIFAFSYTLMRYSKVSGTVYSSK